jgi:hypothetical protein
MLQQVSDEGEDDPVEITPVRRGAKRKSTASMCCTSTCSIHYIADILLQTDLLPLPLHLPSVIVACSVHEI